MATCQLRTLRIEFTSADGDAVSLAADLAEPASHHRGAALYMPGFGSVRNGEKAMAFAQAFTAADLAFLSFDPRGHGESSGTLEGLTLERHLEDLSQAWKFVKCLHSFVAGIGSSLGGLALAAFEARNPHSLDYFVGIGTAFGFHEKWSRVPASARPPALTPAAIRSARALRTASLAPRFAAPALLWHGMKDDAVRWQEAARFAALASSSVELRLIGDGDHRLTQWKDRLARESVSRVIEALEAKIPLA